MSGMKMRKTVLVSCFAPPQIGGTAAVLHELLIHFPSDSVEIVTGPPSRTVSRDDRVLKHNSHYVRPAVLGPYLNMFRFVLIPFILFAIVRRVKKNGQSNTNLLAVFPSLEFLSASVIASKIQNVPIFIYMHDCIVPTARGPVERVIARLIEERILPRASRVYAVSSLMRDYYLTKGLILETLPHGVNPKLKRRTTERDCGESPSIGFAGAIYETNDKGIEDLVEAKRLLGGRLRIRVATTGFSAKRIQSSGMYESIDTVETYPTHNGLLDFLASCDILFLPMNFESSLRGDLLTVFPTKVTDYWLAQQPILTYGPTEYGFVSLSVRRHFALAVTRRSPEDLAKAIVQVCSSSGLRTELVNGSNEMIEEHDSGAIAEKLISDLS